MTPQPVVAVSAYQRPVSFDAWTMPACFAPQTYIDAVVRAGGVPVILPPGEHGEVTAALHRLGPVLSGILVIGGDDVDPACYGDERAPETAQPNRARDTSDLAMINRARVADLPILAICRGMQIMNVAYGGTLVQHLSEPELAVHAGETNTFAKHPVVALDDRAERWTTTDVHSHHHQGVKHLGKGLRAVAKSADGQIEAFADDSMSFSVGVLWHPEEGEPFSGAGRLFDDFIAAATRFNPLTEPRIFGVV